MSPSRREAKPIVHVVRVHAVVDELFEQDNHAARVRSLADSVVGVVQVGALGIHAIGRGLAAAKGLCDKHAIKQVDRCVGNEKLDVEVLQAAWVKHWCANRTEMVVNLDWTEFGDDGHSMLVLSLQTDHGRSMPLVWKSVDTKSLKGRRNGSEDELLVRFRSLVPDGIKVTVVADRGFGDQKLYAFLRDDLRFDYIIRFRGVVAVTDAAGNSVPARDRTKPDGRLRVVRGGSVTADMAPVPLVVLVHEKGMKEGWCLATSRDDLTGSTVKRLYGKRFTCEETFRDVKDWRFGFGMRWQRVSSLARRDRMMLMAVLALHVLSLLGRAGENAGLGRLLMASTSTTRTLSLVRQGLRWYELLPTMPEERLALLMLHFETLIGTDPFLTAVF